MNFFESKEAPPTKKPSMLSIFFNKFIFFKLTDPPYKTFTPLILLLINLIVSYNSS